MGSLTWAVLVGTPAGSSSIMVTHTKVTLVFCLLASSSMGARHLRNNRNRDGKSLVNTFPFNANEDAHHGAHGDHGAGHHATVSIDSRANRQGDSGTSVNFGDVAGASPGSDGKRCIDKVE